MRARAERSQLNHKQHESTRHFLCCSSDWVFRRRSVTLQSLGMRSSVPLRVVSACGGERDRQKQGRRMRRRRRRKVYQCMGNNREERGNTTARPPNSRTVSTSTVRSVPLIQVTSTVSVANTA
ncbi:unnamed protein product [Pleuronectes platessa]|uniref:Uncharacterized protein n=1 Tax=Pleuronectes platessa TaxID=8262 RepID=A0A9N7VFC0_PLEPL|nr:unnamed protein product [Pleuronectes platessa]